MRLEAEGGVADEDFGRAEEDGAEALARAEEEAGLVGCMAAAARDRLADDTAAMSAAGGGGLPGGYNRLASGIQLPSASRTRADVCCGSTNDARRAPR